MSLVALEAAVHSRCAGHGCRPLCIGTPGFCAGGSLDVNSGGLVMRRHGRPDLRAGLGDTWYEEKRSYQKKIGDMPF